jgi:hypothetical protein
VYPNPGNGELTVTARFEAAKSVGLNIFDALGRVVFTQAAATQVDLRANLDISHLPSGTYFIRIHADGEQWIRKYLKE